MEARRNSKIKKYLIGASAILTSGTAVAQIAAHEIGVKPEDVVIGDNDTARMPGPGHAGGSRQTFMVGNVVALACREARKRLLL